MTGLLRRGAEINAVTRVETERWVVAKGNEKLHRDCWLREWQCEELLSARKEMNPGRREIAEVYSPGRVHLAPQENQQK
jgi:hypothetical protein